MVMNKEFRSGTDEILCFGGKRLISGVQTQVGIPSYCSFFFKQLPQDWWSSSQRCYLLDCRDHPPSSLLPPISNFLISQSNLSKPLFRRYSFTSSAMSSFLEIRSFNFLLDQLFLEICSFFLSFLSDQRSSSPKHCSLCMKWNLLWQAWWSIHPRKAMKSVYLKNPSR